MSEKDKEDLMVKVIPLMMKKVDIKKLAPNFLKEASENISLYNVYELILEATQDKEFVNLLKEKIEVFKNGELKNFNEMMKIFMPGVMPKMMKTMMPMMKNMEGVMPEVMDKCFTQEEGNNSEMKQNIGSMMSNMIPQFFSSMLPKLEKHNINEIKEILKNTVSELEEGEKNGPNE